MSKPKPTALLSSFNNPALADFRLVSGDGDEWGTAMGWQFAICRIMLSNFPDDLPYGEWEYSPSPLYTPGKPLDDDDLEDDAYTSMIFENDPSVEALLLAGRTMNRYLNMLRLAGRDY